MRRQEETTKSTRGTRNDRNFLCLLCFLWFLISSCARAPIPQQGAWIGAVELAPGKVLPFRMNLDFSGASPSGYFLVSDEKTPIPEISRTDDKLILRFSEYGAEMRAAWDGRQLTGDYVRIRSSGTKSFPFKATPETKSSPADPLQIPVGNYQVLFQGEDKVDDSTVAKLWSKDGASYGTFIAPDGDYGLLSAQRVGDVIQLNRFTGWQATIITLQQKGGRWGGEVTAASTDKQRRFVLRPCSDLNLEPGPAFPTTMKDSNSEFAFSGTTLSGETIRNTDDRFKGKALLLDIMGTWCHNCLDEAPVLRQIQQEFGKDGLEVIGLSFEISNDAAL